MLRALAALFSLVAHAAALAADGDVDRAFGDDGQVTIRRDTDSPTSRTPTGDVLALADGAYLWSFPNEDASLSIGRTLHDGAPDLAFGDEGTGRITLSACVDDAPSFLASDGNGGAFAWTGACIVHVLADGTLADDAGGVAIFGDDYYVTDFARDAAGRFVFAATTGQTFDVLRVTADGVTPDASFGDAGHVRVEIAAVNGLRAVNALAVRPDGRIVAVGSRGNTNGPNLVVAAFAENGALDPAWNGGAVADIEPPDGLAGMLGSAVAIDADGSVVVGGYATSGFTGCCLMLTRFDASGAIAPGFGIRLYDLGNTSLGSFFEGRDEVALRDDGTILLATTAFPFVDGRRTQFVLLRAAVDGTLDETFGGRGWRGYTIDDPDDAGQTGDYDELHAIAASDDGVLLLGRTFFEDQSNGHDYVSMVRASFARANVVFADGFDVIAR